MEIIRHTLSNGLKTVIIEKTESSVVSTSVYVGAGGRYEHPDNFGISHFLEHMAFKGTKQYPTAEAFAGAIESIGGKQNAWTSHDHTGFWNIVPLQHQALAFDTLSEQISELLLDAKEIEKERGVIIEEINLYYDDPGNYVWEKLGEVLWPGQPIGSDLLGPKENIRKLTRDDFINYMTPLYHAQNMTVCVVGGGSARTVINELESTFGRIGKGERIKPLEVIFDQTKPCAKLFYRDIEQAHAVLAYKTFSLYDKRRFCLDVLAAILGRGMGSILFKEIREKRGLAYSIYVVNEYYSEFGYLAIYAGLNKDKIKDALKVTKEILADAKEQIFDQETIKRAKEYVKGGYVISLENSQNLSNFYAEREFLDPEKPEVKEILAIIDKITAEELLDVANVVFRPERENLTVVGPYEKEEVFVKMLG